MRAFLFLAAVAVVLTIAQAGSSASHPVGWFCSPGADVIQIFSNIPSEGSTAEGASPATFTTPSGGPLCVDTIATTHRNTDPGPITIDLNPVDANLTGQGGPWNATPDATKTIWTATPSVGNDTAVIQGTYKCVDSTPATWTYAVGDPATAGFCEVRGRFAQADGTPPTVSFDSPTNNSVVGGSVAFNVTASDVPSGIDRVEVQTSTPNPDSWTTRATGRPTTVSWNSRNVADGVYSVRLAAFDIAGNETDTAAITLTVDNTPPTLTLQCNDGSGATTCGTNWYTVSRPQVIATSDGGPIVYAIDAPPISNSALTYTGPINAASGDHTYYFSVADAVGNLRTAQVEVKVDTSAPAKPSITLGGSSVGAYLQQTANGYQVWWRPGINGEADLAVPQSDDPDSGIASASFPLSPLPGGWGASKSGASAAYTWVSDASSPGPSFSVSSTNGAGLTSQAPTAVGFTADANQPTGGVTCDVANCSSASGSVTATASVTDNGGAGIKDVRYTTDGSTPTATTGTPGTSVTLNHNATVTFWAIDNVGNAGVVATQPVTATPGPGNFTVNTQTEGHDAIAGDGICAAANGNCTLRAAVEEANALPAGSTITVPAGGYQLNLRQSAFGPLTVSQAMTITGAGARTTLIAAPGDDRAIDVAATANPVTISGFEISGGMADASNGFFGGDVRSAGTLTLSHDAITNGVAGSGGGVSNWGGTMLIDHSTIANNVASIGGGDSGGIQDWGDGTHHGILTIRNSTISGNEARLGGGIFVWNDPGNTVTILDSTIASNNATDRGIGGIGIADGANAVIRNSVVAYNTQFHDNTINCSVAAASGSIPAATLTSLGHNLASNGDCAFTATGDRQSVDPQLGPLGNNGGQTDTMLPAGASPLINAGDDKNCPTDDQIGTHRPQAGHCDIGAVEALQPAFVVTNTADAGAGSLRGAIASANASANGGRVTFAIPGGGVQTITPASALPALADNVTIDGYTQPGAQPETNAPGAGVAAVLNIRIDGSNLASGAVLTITGSNNAVRGLVIGHGPLYAIQLTGAAATNNTIAGNYLGTTADGLAADGVLQYAIDVRNNANHNTIGGSSPADRNVISGSIDPTGAALRAGIDLALGAAANTVVGNLIGTAANGTGALGNGRAIIVQGASHDNVIGDGSLADGNVIGFNIAGIDLLGGTNTTVNANWVGVDFISAGITTHVGNQRDGIDVEDGATGNVIENNIVANSGGDGIAVTGTGQATLTQNHIRNSGQLGIDLGGGGAVTPNDAGDGDTGPNGLQNFPVITRVTSDGTVTGTLDSAPSSTYTVEAFGVAACNRSGYGEGNGFIGSAANVQTDANGHGTFTITGTLSAAATGVSATATDSTGDTSEFSACFQISQSTQLTVNSADDHDDGACTPADCTLREAINAANISAVPATIRFAILQGAQTIHLTSALPALTHQTTIDGTSQPGWVAAPIITLDGSALGPIIEGSNEGIVVAASASGSVIRGLIVNGFFGIGIHVFGNSTTVAGNYATANTGDGIRIENASNATVGGSSAFDRNVVGGNGGHGIFLLNAQSSTVRGNYSGSAADGATANANAIDGIAVDGGGGNTIAGNVASGNRGQGISVFRISGVQTAGNTVRGNIVGATADGTGVLANGGDGIRVDTSSNNMIGGIGDGQGNTVRGNGVAGIAVQNEGSSGNTISGNSINTGNGAGPAIALRSGSNGSQPAPAVTQSDAAHVGGTLQAAPNTIYTIEVFQSPAPIEGSCTTSQAVTFVGTGKTTTDANGAATWSVAAAVDPGSVATATATSPSGNTSQLSACLQTIASSSLHATLTVDQSSTTAGAQSFALDSLPNQLFTQLATGNPASAPIPSAPIPSAAVGAAPIPSAPIPSAPIPSAPIPSAPIPSAPIPSAPIPSAPIPSAGLAGLPIPSAGTANPLDAILLSSLPNLNVDAMFAGTSIAGKLPQQYTLGDVYRTPSALAYLTATYHVSDLNLSGTLLRGVRTLSYLLGGKTLDKVAPYTQPAWCAALANAGGSCTGVDVSKTTVIGLDIAGQLGSLDLGHLKVSDLTNGLDGTLIGEAYLARIAFQQTSIAQIPVSSLLTGVVTCTSCATLGDAAAAHAVVDSVTLKSLGGLLNNVTLNELVVAVTPRSSLPWEQESFVGWQGFGGQAQKLQYHLDWDAFCPLSGLAARVRLPFGFVYVPGSSTLQVGAAAATSVADPALDPKSGATWTNLPVVTCSNGQEHLRINFQAEAGYKLGPSPSSAVITSSGQSTSVSGAPVDVQRNWTAALDRTTEPTIQPDTIVLSHVATAGGTNYFKIPEQGRGKLVTIYMKPPADGDFDLYVVRPSPTSLLASPIPSAPIPSAPIPSAPIPSAPIPSADTSVNTTTDNPAPELLDDGPLPGGQVSVDSITRSAGGMEAVSFRQAGSTGFDEIAVAGYNGAVSDQPFELRVQVQDPPPLPQCITSRNLTPVQPGSLPVGGIPATTQNLALVNVGRMNAMYGTASTATMLSDLQAAMSASPGGGAVIQIDGDAGVASAAAAWDASPCSIDAANNYVHAINALVATYRASLTNLHSITIVGDDEQIPFARVPDFVPTSSELDNTGALSNLLNGGKDNATYAAAGLGYVLTDDVYGAFHTRTLFGHEFFLPEVAVGRLVETPAEIDGQLLQFVNHAQPRTLDASSGFVTGYDFMSDGSKAVDDGLAGRIGPAPSSSNTLLRDTWGKSALQGLLNGTQASSKINAWNAHYDYHRLMPAVYTGSSDLLDTSLVPAPVSQQFQGDIFFTMGCHAGESIADTLLPQSPLTRDWAQTYSQSGAAVFIGNTGFGYGDTASVALSERLMSIFAGHLAFTGSLGEKFLQTKNDYWSTMGAFGPYDEKTLEEATFYGLPFWQVNSPGESSPTPPATQADTGVGAGLTVAPITITPQLTKVTDARGTFWKGGDGTVFIPGRTVQPLSTVDVTQPVSSGLVAHGFYPSGLVTDDSNKDVDLYIAKPMIDQGSHEPEPSVTNDVFPASPAKMAQADYLGQRHSTLDLIGGQSRPGSKPTLHNERLITSVSGNVTYAPASATDFTPPAFEQTGSVVQSGTATIFAKVSDSSGVIRVEAFFTNGGPWQFLPLAPVTGQPGMWSGTASVSGSRIEAGFVAEDAAANTAWMTGKGILVESVTAAAATPSITIDSPLDQGVYTLKQSVGAKYSCTGLAGATCTGTVANGAVIDTSTVGPKTFHVDATPIVGNPAQKDAHYIVGYNFGGFQPPISPTANNVIKAGSSVPIKFSLHGNQGLNIFAPGYPQSANVPCTGGSVDATALSTTSNSGLSYDAASDTYTYVWQTQKTWTGCRQLLVVLNDGVVHRVNFQLK